MPNPFKNLNPQQAAWVGGILPHAQRWSSQTGIPAEVYVAILASETNYGKAPTYFGIKGSGTAGSQSFATHEVIDGQTVNVNDNFAIYNNPDEAHDAFIKLLSTSPRYADAWQNYQETGSWQNLLQGINVAGYATDPNWASKIVLSAFELSQETGNKLTNGAAPGARSLDFGGGTDAQRVPGAMGFVEPKLEDFKIYEPDPVTGRQKWTGEYDVVSYNRAMAEYQANNTGMEDDFAQYLDAVINAASTEIQMGNANVSKARQEFERQMKAHEVGQDAFNQLLGYALPPGTQYAPFREPGGLVERQLGMPARQAPNMPFDPFAEAWKVVQNTPDLTQINTNPTGTLLPQAIGQARSIAAGGNGAMPSPPPPAGAPTAAAAPSPNAQQLAQQFLMASTRYPNYAGNVNAQYG